MNSQSIYGRHKPIIAKMLFVWFWQGKQHKFGPIIWGYVPVITKILVSSLQLIGQWKL